MPLQTLVRRAAVSASIVAATAVCVVAGATPALADVPENWSNPAPMSVGHLLVIIVAIPVGLALVISLLAVLPGLVRGEGLTGGHAGGEWLGGPRQGTAELAGPDDEGTEAGGASARW